MKVSTSAQQKYSGPEYEEENILCYTKILLFKARKIKIIRPKTADGRMLGADFRTYPQPCLLFLHFLDQKLQNTLNKFPHRKENWHEKSGRSNRQ